MEQRAPFTALFPRTPDPFPHLCEGINGSLCDRRDIVRQRNRGFFYDFKRNSKVPAHEDIVVVDRYNPPIRAVHANGISSIHQAPHTIRSLHDLCVINEERHDRSLWWPFALIVDVEASTSRGLRLRTRPEIFRSDCAQVGAASLTCDSPASRLPGRRCDAL
jgi:hypothetical protein